MWTPTVANCDNYLNSRTGKYEWRAVRYRAALNAMKTSFHGLTNSDTVLDVGAGWTEFDYCLRAEGEWKGRYIPVDGGIDNTDLNSWIPPRLCDWIVALEILEHVHDPWRLLFHLQLSARKGLIISTPNPATTDVLGMDPTHVSILTKSELESRGLTVEEKSFYGEPRDSLFGTWFDRSSNGMAR